jgi:hypothetical protein
VSYLSVLHCSNPPKLPRLSSLPYSFAILRSSLPLELLVGPDHAFVVDVKLPNKDTGLSGITDLLGVRAGESAWRFS